MALISIRLSGTARAMRFAPLLFAFVLQAAPSHQPPPKQQGERADSAQHKRKAEHSAPPSPTPKPDTAQRHQNASAEQGKSSFLAFSLTDLVVAAFTVVLAFVAILQRRTMEAQRSVMDAQRTEMERQRTTMDSQLASMQAQEAQLRASVAVATKSADAAIVAQRPWLKIESAEPVGLVRISAEGITATMHVVLRNVGNTPALNVRSHMRLQLRPAEEKLTLADGERRPKWVPPAIRSSEEFLDATDTHIDVGGIAVFPNDQLPINSSSGTGALDSVPRDRGPLLLRLGFVVRYDFVGGRGATKFGRILMRRDRGSWDVAADQTQDVEANFIPDSFEVAE